jgi:hypothetical protein
MVVGPARRRVRRRLRHIRLPRSNRAVHSLANYETTSRSTRKVGLSGVRRVLARLTVSNRHAQVFLGRADCSLRNGHARNRSRKYHDQN